VVLDGEPRPAFNEFYFRIIAMDGGEDDRRRTRASHDARMAETGVA
jgi:hypothetical protein